MEKWRCGTKSKNPRDGGVRDKRWQVNGRAACHRRFAGKHEGVKSVSL
jgi:hypothetical protein